MSETTPRRLRRIDPLMIAVVTVPLIATLLRFPAAVHRPLWLDETFTAMIASQPTLSDFIRQCYFDAAAPLFYILERLWIPLAGQSDLALRVPGLFFSAAAPLVALSRASGASRGVRLLWCVLLACWIPGNYFAPDARCYSLMLFLATANAVAFARVLRAPGLGAAFVWTGLSALIILTHYFGLVLAAVQGVVYLGYHRGRAVRTWPATILYLPAFAVLAIHAQRLAAFAAPGQGWIEVIGFQDVVPQLWFLLGGRDLVWILALWIGVALLVERLGRRAARSPPTPPDHGLWIVALCSFGAVLCSLILGLLRPVFIMRYLTPVEPGILLGLALYARRLASSWRWAPAMLGLVYLALLLRLSLNTDPDARMYNFEIASRALMPARPTRLVYAWDVRLRTDPSALAQLGGYFFRREGRPISVDPVEFTPGEDPNAVLIAHAQAPGSAIIWMYDTQIKGTAAVAHPPAKGLLRDPNWRCRDFGDEIQVVIACQRAPWRAS